MSKMLYNPLKLAKQLETDQNNLKSKESSIFWLSLGLVWLFSKVLRVYCLFLRFQLYFGHS